MVECKVRDDIVQQLLRAYMADMSQKYQIAWGQMLYSQAQL